MSKEIGHSKDEEDEVEFERALSSVDGKSPRGSPHANDENCNINANMQDSHQTETKQKKISVARIQKNKVNFLS